MRSRIQPEPFKIKAVEPIGLPDRSVREKVLAEASYNLFGLKSDDVYVDLLTDSGTGAMSAAQWAALMMGDEAYAGAKSFYALKDAVKEILGFDYVIPTHQGRGAENVLFGTLCKKGDVVPFNMPFDTTMAHLLNVGAKPVECVTDEAFDLTSDYPFKGNVDTKKLEAVINRHRENIPLIMVTVTNNSGGGQPVSLQNIKDTSQVARKYGIPFFLDAARMAENAYFIKTRESSCAHLSLKEIIRAMADAADGLAVSCKKDPLVNIGGMITCRSEKMYHALLPRTILYEGFATYGGLAGRDLQALAQGLAEMTDEGYMAHRVAQVRYLGELLDEAGVPFVKPAGGHAIFVDAASFLPHIPQQLFPADVLAAEVYIEGGVRGIGLGALAFATSDPETGSEVLPKLELFRLAIPRRTYTNSHMEYVADVVNGVYRRREDIAYGLELIYEPPVKGIRHFLGKLHPKGL